MPWVSRRMSALAEVLAPAVMFPDQLCFPLGQTFNREAMEIKQSKQLQLRTRFDCTKKRERCLLMVPVMMEKAGGTSRTPGHAQKRPAAQAAGIEMMFHADIQLADQSISCVDKLPREDRIIAESQGART